jgi:acyl-CoA thioesterase
MTEFSALLASMQPDGDGYTITVGDDWLQGRTIYGGLAAALCAECALRSVPDLPPVRSAQFTFVGPATGRLKLQAMVLRRGKSTVFVSVTLSGDDGLATQAAMMFGAARPSILNFQHAPAPRTPAPDELRPIFPKRAPLPFLDYFDGRHAGASRPFSNASDPTIQLWLKHRDPDVVANPPSLLALADVPPPGAFALLDRPVTISTATWFVDFVTEQFITENGWWLMQVATERAQGGYTSQAMTMWNTKGEPVMICRQNLAVFV